MNEEEILSGLEKLAGDLGVKLRYEKGDFRGGYCVLKDEPMLILQKRLENSQKIRILARELGQKELDGIYLVPAIREVIDDATAELKENKREESAPVEKTEEGMQEEYGKS